MLRTVEAQALQIPVTPTLQAEFEQYDFEHLRRFASLIHITSIGIWLLFDLIVSFQGQQGFTYYSMIFLALLATLTIAQRFCRKARQFHVLNLLFVLVIAVGVRLVIEGIHIDLRPGWLILGASSILYSASVLPLSRGFFLGALVTVGIVLNPFMSTALSPLEFKGTMVLTYALFLCALTLYSFTTLRQAKIHNYVMSKLLLDQAYLDALTEIPNRRSFMTLAERQLKETPRDRDHYLGMIDIDNFKKVNDVHGHDIGDEVLKRIAADIKHVMAGFQYARLGGEEFALYLAGVRREDVEALMARLGQVVREHPTPYPVTISIGLARVEAADTLHQALVNADAALYQSKHHGKDCYTFYT